jgi:hypothetical protein
MKIRSIGPLARRCLERITKHSLDISLAAITLMSLAALILANDDPFARDALCAKISFCPTIANPKAWNKIFYDLAAGALVSLIFYVLVVRIPDRQRRKRYKKSFTRQYKNFREDCIGILLGVADGTYEWGRQQELLEHEKFREYFDQWVTRDQTRWHRFLNNLDEYNLNELIRCMEIFQREIAFILNNVDISSEEPFEFLKRLSAAIYSMQNKTLGYDDTKFLGGFLWSVFAGFDFVTGYRKRDIIQEMIDAI